MFEEIAFSDDDKPEENMRPRKRVRHDVQQAPMPMATQLRPSAKRRLRTTLHRPGEPEFRAFASVDTSLSNDPTSLDSVAAGDLWTSAACHCWPCEILRIGSKLASLTPRAPTATSVPPSVVGAVKQRIVLVDLDNFGYHQFQRLEPPCCSQKNAHYLSSSACLLWAFYGACFKRHFNANPEELATTARRDSVWGAFLGASKCMFTPCGGHRDAADEVIGAAAYLLLDSTDADVVILTGDKNLSEIVRGNCAPFQKRLRIVNVSTVGRKLHDVWPQVCARVHSHEDLDVR